MPLSYAQPPTAVVALVEEALRPSLAEATINLCQIVYVASISQVIAATHDRRVRALLVSPSIIASERLPQLAQTLEDCSDVVTVAVISERRPEVDQGLLDLGTCGVRKAVDLGDRRGWTQLRELVTRAGDETTNAILRLLAPILGDCSPEFRNFVEQVIRHAPRVTNVRALAFELRVHPSTLMSRFFRAKLPAPKDYLAAARLIYAASFFGTRTVSVARVADRLEYSSPQSFGRHVKTVMGITAVSFRYRYSLEAMVGHFTTKLIEPHANAIRTFDPLGPRPKGRAV